MVHVFEIIISWKIEKKLREIVKLEDFKNNELM